MAMYFSAPLVFRALADYIQMAIGQRIEGTWVYQRPLSMTRHARAWREHPRRYTLAL